MNESEDYEYSGRQSSYPPLLQLLGYFGFGLGGIWFSFDRLGEFSRFEQLSSTNQLQPMIRVHWLEKILYGLGGKYLVFSFGMAFGTALIGFGIWRLISWYKLRRLG